MGKTTRLATVALAAVAAAAIAPVPFAAAEHRPITDTAAVQRELDLLTTVDRIPGALAQVRDRHGRSVTLTSGTAELGTGRPMVGPDGRFRIASVTKTFTAVAVLQLVAERRVRLDDPVERYLPGVVRGTGEGAEIDGRNITVRQLLQHTSGIPNYVKFLDPARLTDPVEPATLVSIALSHRPDFPPGQGWKYNNTGFVLAGMLVERLTGKDIATAVTERVIRRAGLRDTYWPPAGERTIRGPHARNYAVHPANPQGPLVDVTEFEASWASASGAVISTPSDLNRFWQHLLDGRLLPNRALAEMRADPVEEPGAGLAYGLGLIRISLSCGEAWGHGGDLLGVATVSARTAAGRTATVYITAVTIRQAVTRLIHTLDVALCS